MAERHERRSLSSTQAVGRSQAAAYGERVLPEVEMCPIRNFYQQLHITIQQSPIALPIPETLLVSEDGHEVLLFTDESGAVQARDSIDIWSLFIDQCSAKLARNGDLTEWPLFIFVIGSTQVKVLFSVAEARKLWTNSKDHTKLMQRYVIPVNKEPAKLRIIWSRGETKRFNIKKKSFEGTQREAKKPQPVAKQPSYNYAGKLQKSSFSPYMPYKSTLSASPRGQTDASPPSFKLNESYYVSSEAESDSVTEQIYLTVPEAEAFADPLKSVLCPLMLREEEILNELSYDTIQDIEGRYVLLNVKWIRAVPIRQEIATTAGIETKHRDVRKRFTQLVSSEHSSKTPFIDLHEIQEKNVKMYLQHFSTLPPSSQLPKAAPNSVNLRAEIEEAGSKLDSLVQAAVINKMKSEEDQKVRLESYPKENFLDYIIAKVYAKVTSDPELKMFFHNMDQREINMIKFGFSKAFTGVDNYYFKRTVKKVHEGLGISSAHFERFIELFLACLREEGVRSEDVEIVQRHLSRFMDEVVEDDTPGTSP